MKFFTLTLSNILVASVVFAAATTENPASKAPPKVDVYIVKSSADMQIPLEYPARIVSSKDATVTARVTGVLQKNIIPRANSYIKEICFTR